MANNPKSTTGGEVDVTQDQFAVQTVSSTVSFDMEDINPPAESYIGVNDRLVISVFSFIANQPINADVLILRPDGQIIAFPCSVIATAQRTQIRQVFQLLEGFILSVNVTTQAGLNNQNQGYCAVSIARPPFTDQSTYRLLCAGYVNAFTGFGFPTTAPQRMTDGAGIVSSYSVSNPAAGADWVFTVPVNGRVRLMSLTATLTAAVAVANRDVTLVVDDGANIVAQISAGFALVASTANTYTFGDSMNFAAAFNGISVAPTPSQLVLRAGWRVRSVTANIQAADQWSSITLGVQEWLEAQ